MHNLRRVLGESPETMRKLWLSIKFPHQEIRCNYGILYSEACSKLQSRSILIDNGWFSVIVRNTIRDSWNFSIASSPHSSIKSFLDSRLIIFSCKCLIVMQIFHYNPSVVNEFIHHICEVCCKMFHLIFSTL